MEALLGFILNFTTYLAIAGAIFGAVYLVFFVFNLLLLWKVIEISKEKLNILQKILSIIIPFYLPIKASSSIECSKKPWLVAFLLIIVGGLLTTLVSLEVIPILVLGIIGAIFTGAGSILLGLLNYKLYVDIMYIAEVSTWYIVLFGVAPVVVVPLYFKIRRLAE